MRRLLTLALAAGWGIAAVAQHGGGGHGGGGFGGGGGGSMHASGGFAAHPGVNFAAHNSAAFAGSRAYGYGYGRAPGMRGPAGTRAYGGRYPLSQSRPSFSTARSYAASRRGSPGWEHRFRIYPDYGVGGWLGYPGVGYLGFDDGFDNDFDDGGYDDGGGYAGTGQAGWDAEPYPGPGDPGLNGDPYSLSASGPGRDGAPAGAGYTGPFPGPAAGPQSPYAPAPAPLAPESAVTLIFKDGRAPEQIHNYALTRSTLYVRDPQFKRDIPVDQLDLAATAQANQAAGVDFALPRAAAQ